MGYRLDRSKQTEVWRARSLAVAIVLGGALAGCGSEDTPPTTPSGEAVTPASGPATKVGQTGHSAPVNPIIPESANWSRSEALKFLEDDQRRLSAAVRLVRLAEVKSPLLPEPLPAADALKLGVVRLTEELYALGAKDSDDAAALHEPLLLTVNGQATRLSEEGEHATLYVSADTDIVPHLLVGRRRVMNLDNLEQAALALKSPERAYFALRRENGVTYVVLMCCEPAAGAEPVELARYRWDAYDLSFMGPARDVFPKPSDEVFQLDLEASAALQPVGGQIPSPEPAPPKEGGPEDDIPPF